MRTLRIPRRGTSGPAGRHASRTNPNPLAGISSEARTHLIGWIVLALISFLQPPGRTAADTKFDLSADPAGFLAQATQAYTDTFTLGQIQNQAYGYLFPHGLFFLLTEFLPDWVAQRLWWTVVMGVAFSGMYRLSGSRISAALYALSPRILTTLTAISSEAWPVALVPWTLVPLMQRRPNVAAAVIPVALMGAVNATATMMACLPAFVLLIWLRAWPALAKWLVGVAAVSAWWIGPLLVLGRYSPPFTDFIESSFVTTRWLNLAELLRGTTSWSPFVDTERVAGHLLVTEPVFVLATLAIAALGIAGLALEGRGYPIVLLCLGVALMGTHASFWLSLLDAPLAPFRNLHKLDPLVRLPICLGVGYAVARMKPRGPGVVAVVLVAVIAVAPAWTLRLLPEGTWTEVSEDWQAAAAFLNEEAAGTRTLVVPATSFARQTWGWTRDEPIQALTDVPFAVRDAIPLVDPEAIRGLDGQIAALDPEALRSIGVGAVVVRGDLAADPELPELAEGFGKPKVFGDLSVYLFDRERGMMIGADPAAVAGGGEVLPLLDREFGYSPRTLTASPADADIITDTPALVKRNYGTLKGPTTAHLPYGTIEDDIWEGGDVHNRLPDYPSEGRLVGVSEEGIGRASSSAADVDAFGGAKPSKSLNSAFDGIEDTAWHPAPGDRDPWIEAVADGEPGAFTITATDDTTVHWSGTLDSGTLELRADEPEAVDIKGDSVTIELTEPVGISELEFGVRRIVTVDGIADTYFFQRLFPATELLHRSFETEAGTFELSTRALIDGTPRPPGPVTLSAGRHTIVTKSETVALTRAGAESGAAASPWEPFDGTVTASGPASDRDRIIMTARAYNSGLRGFIGDVPLEPTRIDSGMQAFTVPAGLAGEFSMSFAGSRFFYFSLVFGGALSLLGVAACLWIDSRRPRSAAAPFAANVAAAPAAWASQVVTALATLAATTLVGGWYGVGAWLVTLLIRRFTLIPGWSLAAGAVGFMGLWLARAPWPAANYAGDSVLVTIAGCVAIASLAGAWWRRK
ncbi:DUF3367 domain-containing protein [Corynebacterium sp. CCUG 65737]|uniref:alpha-(1->3)-arabinofuranosyltransferase domain-containing protein n=1 Tax=Corynebacterium sp. CCUG 65737 TaxID=2823889 RepID=UPI00210C546A|nr:alpha-(1->3)-arabinofuranosyltransferase family protein [Corynebacterium sp. CCUG 65737]MCQ4627890.1 DUF3367 domain-containing protein [Corynebacterium sp. CCUG 65737]